MGPACRAGHDAGAEPGVWALQAPPGETLCSIVFFTEICRGERSSYTHQNTIPTIRREGSRCTVAGFLDIAVEEGEAVCVRNSFLAGRVARAGTGCPESLRSLPWGYSQATQTQSWVRGCRRPCPSGEVGAADPQSSLQPPPLCHSARRNPFSNRFWIKGNPCGTLHEYNLIC